MRHALSLLALGMAQPLAAAKPPLADPTRPPLLVTASVPRPQPARATAAPGQPAPPESAEPFAPPPPNPVLQSVHLPSQGLPSALVDGRLMRPGDRLAGPWGERHIQAIDAQGLLLAQPGRSPLRLWLLSIASGAPATATSDTAAPRPAATTTSAEPPDGTPNAANLATRSKP